MIRIVLGEPGPEGLSSQAGAIARALRDAGHEVVYAGAGQSPEQLVATALQEDADLIGVVVTTDGDRLVSAVAEVLDAHGASDIGVFATAGEPVAEVARQVGERAGSGRA